jgi:membrane-associated phospholipid phosphatase
MRERSASNPDGRYHRLAFSFLRNWSVPVLYLMILVAVYVRFGFLFQFTLGAVWLCVIPVIAYVARSREFLRNSAFIVTLLLSYEALQGVTGRLISDGSVASLASIDTALFGFNLSSAVQNAFYSASVTLVSTIFYNMHIYLVVAALILFWFTSRKVYSEYAYSIVLTSYLALMTFILMPTAPPWFVGPAQNLLPAGNSMLPSAMQTVQQALMTIESDKLAAFPSLHGAYVTLFAVYAFRVGKKWGLVALIIAGGVYFSTVYLGQHYVMDLVGGAVYSFAAVLLVDRLMARHPQMQVETK